MKKLFLFIIFSTYVLSGIANPKTFSEKQKAIIYSKAIETLSEYQDLINRIGEEAVEDVEMAKSTKEKLLELFINRKVLIYNDLDPSHTLSEFYEAETYASNIILWYPDGILVDLGLANAKVSPIKQHDKDIFSIDILLKKQIEGNYMNKSQNSSDEELTFRIAFSTQGSGFSNFKIAGIRSPESEDTPKDDKTLKEVNSEQLSEAELQKIRAGLSAVLHDYINYLTLMGDPEEYEEDKKFYRESFLKLFKSNEVSLFNDIMPKPEKTFYSPEEYIEAFSEYYPEGIKNMAINMDSAQYGPAIKNDKGGYYSYVYADKFFSGQFKGSEAFRNQTNMMIKIGYVKKGSTYSDFKIESIDKEGYEFYQNDEVAGIPEIAIQPVSREGLALQVFAGVGQGILNDETINNISTQENQYEYDITQNIAIHAGVGIQYFYNDNIGLKAGFQYSQFSTNYSINGVFQDGEITLDNNGTERYQILNASFDSTVNIKSISVPLLCSYYFGKPGKIGFFAEGGINLGFVFQKQYELSGDISSSGYYPFNEPALQYMDYPELGYFNRENLSETGDADIKSFNIGVSAAFGVSLPIGYYNSILIGPEIQYGLSDLNARNNYFDLFGEKVEMGKLNLYSILLKISYIYKL